MKKLLLVLLFVPLVCLSQETDNTNKIDKKGTSWIDLYGETPKAYMMMAERAKSYEERINLYSKAIELDTAYTYAWSQRAKWKNYNGDTEGAFKDYTEIINLENYLSDGNIDLIKSFIERGKLKITMNDLNGACDDYAEYYLRGGDLRIEDADLENYCKKIALEKVKEYKEYLELELISKEYYDEKKKRLTPLILTDN
tara:strand:- start:879 stop:1472 length:594 start_codon:yes stop_codon:yes gene_type:complete